MSVETTLYDMRFKPTGIRNYWISEYGDVVNFDNKKRPIMRAMTGSHGHERVELKISPNVPKKFSIHRLVYEAFVGELIEGLVIEHLDSNPSNNHYTNLRQSTQKENIQTAVEFGLFGKSKEKRIMLHDKANDIYYEFNSIRDAVGFCGLTGDSLYRIRRSPIAMKKYDIVSDKERLQTIETIATNIVVVNNGVEYHKGESPLVV